MPERIGGPPVPATSSLPSTDSGTTTAASGPPVASSAPTGWQPGPGPSGNTVTTGAPLPSLNVRALELKTPSPAELSPAGRQMRAAIDRFTSRVETTLHHDPLSAARLMRPTHQDDPLTEAQLATLDEAANELLLSIPLGALAPGLATTIQARLAEHDIKVTDPSTLQLKDLGKLGSDIAKDIIKDFKQELKQFRRDSPAAYYSLAGSLALAVGYAAWTSGAGRLEQLGIKPELKRRFFDKRLELKARADKQTLGLEARGHLNAGPGVLSGAVSVNTREGLSAAEVGYSIARPKWSLSSGANADAQGFKTLNAQLGYRPLESLHVTAKAAHDFRAERTTASLETSYRPRESFNLSAGLTHDFGAERTTANLEASYRHSSHVDFALSGSHDSEGESRIGAGMRVRF